MRAFSASHINMNKYLLFAILLFPFYSTANAITYKNKIDSIVVYKSQRKMIIFTKGRLIKTYKIAIGQNPMGHKQCQGDNRTPEGKYYINDKNPKSSYYLNLGISYPNNRDRRNAKKRGQNPGGDIKIHGYADKYGKTNERNIRYSSTWGCIAVTNKEMDELFHWVRIGAVILIKK